MTHRKSNKEVEGQGAGPKEARVGQLRELVERASRENPHLTSRLEKAAFLVLLRPVERVSKAHFRIGSEDGLRHYDVIKGHCQCSDYLRHGAGHPCKHRLALSLHQRLGSEMKSHGSVSTEGEDTPLEAASTDECQI